MARKPHMDDVLFAVSEHNVKFQQGITTSHWETNDYGVKCRGCGVAFNALLERIHHCRRCGRMFCYRCVQYQRKLNLLAQPDHTGMPYKVCRECYDEGPQSMGSTRSWTQGFLTLRQYKNAETAPVAHAAGYSNYNYRHKLKLDKEMTRLLTGFRDNMTRSELRRAFSDVRSVFTGAPEWQQSSLLHYGQMAGSCSGCCADFGLLRARHHCTVCGAGVCTASACSSKDLLLYYPDRSSGATESTSSQDSGDKAREIHDCKSSVDDDAKLAIIKVIGSPLKEPHVCLYMRVCRTCKDHLEERQVQQYHREKSSSCDDPVTQAWNNVLRHYDNFRQLEEKIDTKLTQYKERIDKINAGSTGSTTSLSSSGDSNGERSKPKSNIQALAKMQCDLSDHLSQMTTMILDFKHIKPVTEGQEFVFKRIHRAKCEFYQEHHTKFKAFTKKLEDVTPPELLSTIQAIVDQNAINSGYLSMKQLALEVLHLSHKYQLDENLAARLSHTEEVMYGDLKSYILARPGEDWAVHETCVQRLLQDQLKNHRLIKPKPKYLQAYGSNYVENLLKERCVHVTRQIQLQIEGKSQSKRFPASKKELVELANFLANYTTTGGEPAKIGSTTGKSLNSEPAKTGSSPRKSPTTEPVKTGSETVMTVKHVNTSPSNHVMEQSSNHVTVPNLTTSRGNEKLHTPPTSPLNPSVLSSRLHDNATYSGPAMGTHKTEIDKYTPAGNMGAVVKPERESRNSISTPIPDHLNASPGEYTHSLGNPPTPPVRSMSIDATPAPSRQSIPREKPPLSPVPPTRSRTQYITPVRLQETDSRGMTPIHSFEDQLRERMHKMYLESIARAATPMRNLENEELAKWVEKQSRGSTPFSCYGDGSLGGSRDTTPPPRSGENRKKENSPAAKTLL